MNVIVSIFYLSCSSSVRTSELLADPDNNYIEMNGVYNVLYVLPNILVILCCNVNNTGACPSVYYYRVHLMGIQYTLAEQETPHPSPRKIPVRYHVTNQCYSYSYHNRYTLHSYHILQV